MRRARRLWTVLSSSALILAFAWSSGCSFGCESDADCDGGEVCEGFVFGHCELRGCVTDEDCSPGYECTKSTAACEPTCSVLECGPRTVCVDELIGGASCAPGCKDNDDCPARTFCAAVAIPEPTCPPGAACGCVPCASLPMSVPACAPGGADAGVDDAGDGG